MQNIRTYILVGIFTLLSFFLIDAKTENEKTFTVVIDAGHGGKDIGATDNGVKEKDINLKVAKNLESLIKKKMKDTKVVMTRDNDTYLTLQERADKANKSQGDIFISIHTNSVDKRNKNRKNVAGSSVYTLGLHKDENNLDVARRENSVIELETDYEQKYSGFDPQRDESYIIFEMAQKKNLSQSIHFAENIEKELVKSGRQDRGVHQAGFWVLWATSMPSVLVELDFICNPESARYISSDKGAKELAEAIFNALQQYERSWRKTMTGQVTNGLSDTYIDDEDSNLEESYTLISDLPIVSSRKRIHKEDQIKKKSTARRRRSLSSKLLSMENSYEDNNLNYPEAKKYPAMGEEKDEKETILASESGIEYLSLTNSKDKKKSEKKKQKDIKNKEKKKKEKSRKEDAYNAKLNKLVTVYKIQILASADLLNQGNSRFCGLSPITTYKENNLYKYYYGESVDREEIENVLADVRKKIPDAFIVSSQKSIK